MTSVCHTRELGLPPITHQYFRPLLCIRDLLHSVLGSCKHCLTTTTSLQIDYRDVNACTTVQPLKFLVT